MKMSLRYVFGAIMILLITAIAPSCKKKKSPAPSDDTPSTPTVTGTYKMYETGQINFKNNYEIGATIDAKVNGEATYIAVLNDSILSFMALPPTFKVGANTLSFTTDDGPQELAITINAADVIADANTEFSTFTGYLNNQVDMLKSIGAGDTTGYYNSPEMQAALSAAEAELNKLKSEWPSYSKEEKEAVVHYIRQNQAATAAINEQLIALDNFMYKGNHGMDRRTASDVFCENGTREENFKCCASYMINSIGYFLAGQATLMLGAKIGLLNPLGRIFGTVGGTVCGISATVILHLGKRMHTILFKPANVKVADQTQSANDRTTAGTIDFVKGAPKALPITVSLRNMSAQDVGSQSPWLVVLINKIGQYNSLMDKFDFLKRFKLSYAAERQKNYYVSKLSYLSAKVTSNNNVTFGGIGGTPQAPVITFNTTQTSEQTFSFEIVYNDGISPAITIPMQGKILDGSSFCSFSDINQMIQQYTIADPDYQVFSTNENMHAFDEQFHYVLKDHTVACYDNAGNMKKTIALNPSASYIVTSGYTQTRLLVHNGYFWLFYKPTGGSSYVLDKLNMNDGSLIGTSTNLFQTSSSYWLNAQSMCMIGNTGYVVTDGVYVSSGDRDYRIWSVDLSTGTVPSTPLYEVNKNSSGTWKNLSGPIKVLNNNLYVLNEFNGNVGTGNVLRVSTSGQSQVVLTGAYQFLIQLCNKVYAYDKNTSRFVAVP